MSDNEEIKAIKTDSTRDILKYETIMKRIPVKSSTINKMNRISSLFGEDMGDGLKEADMIAFFYEMSFDTFLKSGEIEKRIKSLIE